MPQTIEARPQNLKIDLSVLTAEPADEYHAKKGEYLSSHQLLHFIACPWLYRKKQLGLIDDVDTQALLIGRATHCRILEGAEAFEQQFALGGPVNDAQQRRRVCQYLRRVESLKQTAKNIGIECHQVDVADGGVITSPENAEA